jgi:hypothetical protein
MIRPLRDRHRWLVPLVALVAALVIVAAFSARPAEPSSRRAAEPPSRRAAPRDSLAPGSRQGAPVGRSVAEPRP